MSSGANVISRPYSGQQFSFMPATFDTVAQLLATIKRTFGLPHFSFRELKSSGKMKFYLASMRELHFPARKFRALLDLRVFLTAMEYILGTK